MATPTLLRSKSVETKETKAPPALRGSSDPTTQDEIDEILDLQYICFKGGEQITFILTNRSWLTHGIHLGIKVVQDGKKFTLGFSPSVSGTGLFKPVDAAIFIPDIKVEIALKTGTANILNNTPFLLSKTAAARLNDYTCNGIPGVKETFEMARLNPEDRDEWEEKFLFTKKFVPKNIKYKFASQLDQCTNCQGFLTTIFSDDEDVMETIIPYLHAWASTEVAEKAQATSKPRSSVFDHLEPNTYLGLGGRKSRKKSRKPKKKHRRRRTRKRKRKRKKTKRKRKKKKTKRRTRKKRGRGLGFSRPAKVAAVGALVLGSGAATVSPAAKKTYQEIMRAPCNAPFRQMILPHHPDKEGTIEDFSFVESARQFKKKSCGNTRPTETPKKEKAPPGKSGKRWRREQNEQRRRAKEEARKQSERQEKADRKAGQQNETPEDTTSYGDIAGNIGATAVVGATALGAIGAAHQLLARPNRGRWRDNFKEVDGQRYVRSQRGRVHRDGHKWRSLTPTR